MNANRNTDIVLRALKGRADDRGYVRITREQLALDTGLSVATVRRLIDRLIEDGQIQKRSKRGSSGGLLIRLTNGSQTAQNSAQNSAQNEPKRDVVTQGGDPYGVLPPLLPVFGSQTAQPTTAAHRLARPEEVPESGAELVYTGGDESGKWIPMGGAGATMWIAPNGDAVSIRNMTPGLRRRLGIDR